MSEDGDREVAEVASGTPDSRYPGTIIRAIDRPGRVVVKGQLPPDCTEVIMTNGLDDQVLMMTPPAWDAFSAPIAALNPANPDVDDLGRFMVDLAESCAVDSSTGRVRIPEAIRQTAGLDKPGVQAQLLRRGEGRFEIWSVERFRAVRSERTKTMRDTLRAAAQGPVPAAPADSG
jgi:DNA-binding transcriptional regulator/RsmH inhibitor MraZ